MIIHDFMSGELYPFLQKLGDPAHIIDKDKKIIFLNSSMKEWLRKLGLNSELEGQYLKDAFPFLEGRVFSEYDQVFDGENLLRTKDTTLLKDREIQTETRKILLIKKGSKERFIITLIKNITLIEDSMELLLEKEKKFLTLAEQSPNMIFINYEGRIIYANKKCQEIMGYSLKEFYSPEFDFRDLIDRSDQDRMEENFRKHLSEKEVPTTEYLLRSKEGKSIPVIINSKLINFGDKRAILGIITVILEQKVLEKKLIESKQDLEDKIRARTDDLIRTNRELNAEIVNRKKKEMRIKSLNLKLKEYVRQQSRKVKYFEEKSIMLSENEKKVLFALSRDPFGSCKSLSKISGLSASTVSNIRNKLIDNQYYRISYLPNPFLIGNEFFSLLKADLSRSDDISIRQALEKISRIPEIVTSFCSSRKCFWFIFSKDWKRFNEIFDECKHIMEIFGIVAAFQPQINITLADVSELMLYGFSNIIKARYGISGMDHHEETEIDHKIPRMSQNDKKVARALLINPHLSLSDHNNKTGLSVPTILKAKKNLLRKKILLPRLMPSMERMDIEVLLLTTAKTRCPESDSKFFCVSSEQRCVCLHGFRDYSMAEEYIQHILEITKDIDIELYSTRNAVIEKIDFIPIAKKAFQKT